MIMMILCITCQLPVFFFNKTKQNNKNSDWGASKALSTSTSSVCSASGVPLRQRRSATLTSSRIRCTGSGAGTRRRRRRTISEPNNGKKSAAQHHQREERKLWAVEASMRTPTVGKMMPKTTTTKTKTIQAMITKNTTQMRRNGYDDDDDDYEDLSDHEGISIS